MIIVDAQLHIWAADRPDRPWRAGEAGRAHRPEPITAEDLLKEMDEAGVGRGILVPPSWEGDRNDVVLDAARRYPTRYAAIGRLPLERPEGRTVLERLKDQPSLYGLRFTFHTDRQRPWLTDGTADWLWPAAERADLPLMIHVPGSLDKVDAIAARHPGLRLIIDHLAMQRPKKDEAAFEHLPDLLSLAKHPNIAVKATALPGYSSEAYPFPGLHGYIRQVVDAFGPKRVFWGSDVSRLDCPYRQAITLFTEELPWLSDRDKEWIMGRGVCEWLGWKIPGEAAGDASRIRG